MKEKGKEEKKKKEEEDTISDYLNNFKQITKQMSGREREKKVEREGGREIGKDAHLNDTD